jgi:hypothetical protein
MLVHWSGPVADRRAEKFEQAKQVAREHSEREQKQRAEKTAKLKALRLASKRTKNDPEQR